ncbi:hypothetical protein LPUS_09893 [Lasallia pustulata]|uniref:Uncharacterized protein n=1 Tax=Lasallia pustulata TaxID=136370 RepID=A0A1W5D896_9LECA|nr:hypothetical protein LPUS_09893 [Lasallia pustulata]
MEAQDQEQKQGQSQQRPQLDPPKGLQQALALLKARDDTSRFVGLALLKSILDNNVELQNDPKTVSECWAAIPTKFVDRLLRAGESGKKSKEEAKSMVELAVAVIHTFVVLLPKTSHEDEKLLGRTEGLMSALIKSSSDTIQILQVLLTFASTQKGASGLLQVEDWSPLLEIGPQEPLVLDIVKYTFLNAASKNDQESSIARKLSAKISTLILAFRDTPSFGLLLDCLRVSLTTVPTEVILSTPSWLEPLTKLIHHAFNKPPRRNAANDRQAAVLLSASLLHLYPAQYPPLLFNGSTPQVIGRDSRPASYLFVKLLLIDIRTTIPSLQEILNSPDFHRLPSQYP